MWRSLAGDLVVAFGVAGSGMGSALAGGWRWGVWALTGDPVVAFGVTRSGMGKVLADAQRGRCWGVRITGR
ncbi:hypothetical protein [Craterilacuibacter sp. RT1T]|uniref:hypothetical protein n=1 Tax=Craterilacuibacter sp. RT1T TaxID=2942211 RepID=UPI0020BF21C0|nr:hypothetical protein [Craterilacuibacter sp. RT1T]MCL6264368.1 hypothetical protein [Craterilacuibacter sp. RT1T]